jgi:hypothetical protein
LIEILEGLPGNRYVCIEEGQLAEWLVETLGSYAKEMAVVQPKAHQGHKRDTVDAWALAEQLRVRAKGVYVFKPTTQYRPLREAVRTYGIAVKDMTRAKNRFRSLLRARGIANLDKSIYEPKRRPAWIRKLPAPYRRRAQWLGEQIDSRVEAHGIAESWLKEEAKKGPEVRRLETVPGFGPVRAGQVVALVVTPHRFRTTRQFWSYCGLAIVTRASNEWKRDPSDTRWQHIRGNVQTRGLNRNCCSQLKAVFKGATTTVIGKCQSSASWSQVPRLCSASWSHPIFRVMEPPARWAEADFQPHGATRFSGSWGHFQTPGRVTERNDRKSRQGASRRRRRTPSGGSHELSGVDHDRRKGSAPTLGGGAERATDGARGCC